MDDSGCRQTGELDSRSGRLADAAHQQSQTKSHQQDQGKQEQELSSPAIPHKGLDDKEDRQESSHRRNGLTCPAHAVNCVSPTRRTGKWVFGSQCFR